LVETATPRIIISTAPRVSSTVKMPHGMFQCRYCWSVMDRNPPATASTAEMAMM
jgi:hypothetical protein